jgi:hypothetical protein
MERQSKESRGLEAYCRGGQGQPWAVAPFGMEWNGASFNLYGLPFFSHFLNVNVRI